MDNKANETWRPDERPDFPPTSPYDPLNPDEPSEPLPLPPDVQPQPEVPGREPDIPPVGDPPNNEPRRL